MEQIEQSELKYKPHFGSLGEVVSHKKELNQEQILLELARLKFELNNETMALLKATDDCDPETKKELVRLISLVALTELPNVEELLEEDKEKLLQAIKIVKSYKNRLIH